MYFIEFSSRFTPSMSFLGFYNNLIQKITRFFIALAYFYNVNNFISAKVSKWDL